MLGCLKVLHIDGAPHLYGLHNMLMHVFTNIVFSSGNSLDMDMPRPVWRCHSGSIAVELFGYTYVKHVTLSAVEHNTIKLRAIIYSAGTKHYCGL